MPQPQQCGIFQGLEMSFQPTHARQDFTQRDVNSVRPSGRTLRFGEPSSEETHASTPTGLSPIAIVDVRLVSDWIGETRKVWSRGTANTIELAGVVWNARKQLAYGGRTSALICQKHL